MSEGQRVFSAHRLVMDLNVSYFSLMSKLAVCMYVLYYDENTESNIYLKHNTMLQPILIFFNKRYLFQKSKN